jgi:iron complex transport system ATP-binding protein
MENETIRLEHLSVGYKQKKGVYAVLSDINLSFHAGDFVCLLGANGIGKSTFLRTLSGLLPEISGRVYIENKLVKDYTEKQLSRHIGIVLTEHPRLRNMIVDDLVAMGRAPYTGFWGRLSSKDKAIVTRSMSLISINKLQGRMVDSLSDGERQKVMIARALAQQTPIIILDEPTAFLDFPSKVEVMKLLRQLAHDMNKTILLSTHDLQLATQLGDILLQVCPEGISRVSKEEVAEKINRLLNF